MLILTSYSHDMTDELQLGDNPDANMSITARSKDSSMIDCTNHSIPVYTRP